MAQTEVHECLVRERKGASFDVEQLTYILEGGKEITERKRKIQKDLLADKDLMTATNYHYMSRSEKHTEAVRKQAMYFNNPDTDWNWADASIMMTITHPNEVPPFILHPGMFVPMIESNGSDEQKERWLPLCRSMRMIGTYAQTEMGHGTHIRGLETTATFDPATQEFIIHSPTTSSAKWWPGSLGKTCNHAVIMAQLYTGGMCVGVQPFLTQIRDMDTHQPLPGIEVGDIGPKIGYTTMDNGFLKFDHYRIPRTNMLMKYSQVSSSGEFKRLDRSSNRLSYIVMILARIDIVKRTFLGLSQAATIAVRYSAVRHGISLNAGGGPEHPILDYQTQQYKLLPAVAAAYVYQLVGQSFSATTSVLYDQIVAGDVTSLAELHALSAGLKALATDETIPGMDLCRMACGGHGFSDASGISKIYGTFLPGSTFEGQNTVMFLQTARYLMKVLGTDALKESATLQYLSSKTRPHPLTDKFSLEELVTAFQQRAKIMVERAARRLEANQRKGLAGHDAWNQTTIDLTAAAQAHIMQYVIQESQAAVRRIQDARIAAVLTNLCRLYAVDTISRNSADFIEAGCLSPGGVQAARDQVLVLLATLRPDAVPLVDAFDYRDHELGSALGCYDGQVYPRLWEFAKNNPLNKHQVHPSYEYIRPHLAKL